MYKVGFRMVKGGYDTQKTKDYSYVELKFIQKNVVFSGGRVVVLAHPVA